MLIISATFQIYKIYKNSNLPDEYCDMLSALFPHFRKNSIIEGYSSQSEYRIASPLYFDTYFMLNPPEWIIPDEVVQKFLCFAAFDEMVALLAKYPHELMRKAVIMYKKIESNITDEQKRHLSDFALYFDNYFIDRSHMPAFSYNCIQLSSTFVESYLNTMEKLEWKKYVLAGLEKTNLYALVRASRVLYSCNSCFTNLSNISPDTMSKDFKEIFSEISNHILKSYKKYPDAYESNEFIFMILTLVATNKDNAKEVFDYYVKPQDREKYIKKVVESGYVMQGFEEVFPVEYLQSKRYHETICRYSDGCDTSAYPVLH